MKKFRFIALILALIVVVGASTGLIVRKTTGGQTVMQHSNAAAPASTTPATTGDDEPAAPEAKVFKIPVLIEESILKYFTVTENGVEVDPIDVFEYSAPSSEAESKGGDDPDPESYSVTYVRYLVDPSCSSIAYDHNLRPASIWSQYDSIQTDFHSISCFDVFSCDGLTQRSGSIDLSGFLSIVIYNCN